MKQSKEDQQATTRLMLGFLCAATEPAAPLIRKVQILDRFDLNDGEIARICGASAQSVRNARVILRKKKR